MNKWILYITLITLWIGTAFALHQSTPSHQKYHIDIKYKTMNVTGKHVKAMSVGGSIPGKIIHAKEGQQLSVTFHNKMNKPTSIHWHGILLPHRQDGVPYLNTKPIKPGQSHTYTFPVKHSGTYWYHSHTGLQEQRGVYGALIFHPKKKILHYDKEYVLVIF